jgi:hypothetical protein
MPTIYKNVEVEVEVEVFIDDLSDDEIQQLTNSGRLAPCPTWHDLHAAFLRGEAAVVQVAREMVYGNLGRIV